MDLSLLLLVTPMMPPPGPPPTPPGRAAVCVPAVTALVGAWPRPGEAVGLVDAPRPDCCPAGALDAPWPWPARMGTKSSFVIGSLYFLRRNRSVTSTSRFGGKAFAYLRWNRPIA